MFRQNWLVKKSKIVRRKKTQPEQHKYSVTFVSKVGTKTRLLVNQGRAINVPTPFKANLSPPPPQNVNTKDVTSVSYCENVSKLMASIQTGTH